MKYRTLVTGLLLLSGSASAKVLDMSVDVFAQYAAQEAAWEVTVTCESKYQAGRIIHQNVEGGQWCSKQFSNICHSQKKIAAEMVCSDSVELILQAAEQKSQQAAQQKQQAEQRKRELARQLQVRQAEEQRLVAEKRQQERQRREAQAAKKQQADQQRTRSALSGFSEQDNQEQAEARINIEEKLLLVEQEILKNQRLLLTNRQRTRLIEQQLSIK